MKSKYDELLNKIDFLLCTLENLIEPNPETADYAARVLGGHVDLFLDAARPFTEYRRFRAGLFRLGIIRDRVHKGEHVETERVWDVIDTLEDFKKEVVIDKFKEGNRLR